MSDNTPTVLPFGKYKGRVLEEVLIDDPGYLDWCMGQDWFRARFGALYQIIINRGAAPEDTPEHNEMQGRFLDDDYCIRFLRLTPSRKELIHKEMLKRRETILAKILEDDKDSQKHAEFLAMPIPEPVFNISRDFEEDGVDVDVYYTLSWTDCGEKHVWELCSASIEIKPSVGDDYPSVLRQIRAHKAGRISILKRADEKGDFHRCSRYEKKCKTQNILFVGKYTGTGITQEKFVQLFRNSGIIVIFEEEVV